LLVLLFVVLAYFRHFLEKFIGQRSVIYELAIFYSAHEMPVMIAMRGIIAENASIVLLKNKVMDKSKVVADDVSGRVLPCFFANFSGFLAALDVHFHIDDFFQGDRARRMIPVSREPILTQPCRLTSYLLRMPPSTINPAMPTRVRSHAKINLGLAIGPAQPDGYHALTTIYQTLAIHDFVDVTASLLESDAASEIAITCNEKYVPCDARNTCWQIVERALDRMKKRLKISAKVTIHIDKRLPIQGGLGAGSANAVAALIGLEKELGVALSIEENLQIAAETGSDVPLFLVGGTVLGSGRGEQVSALPDLPETHCVLAVPSVRVSTPQAFRDWDQLQAEKVSVLMTEDEPENALTSSPGSDRLERLGRTWAAALAAPKEAGTNATGVFPAASGKDRAENLLLELVRAGIVNDFEEVVFTQYPSLRGILETLKQNSPSGSPAIYAALSGSGSALFGLYRTAEDSRGAVERLAAQGVATHETRTVGREEYWRTMIDAL
jgi:4-diphosphocytidyl-2-C-methyl-D-erythritol kinase